MAYLQKLVVFTFLFLLFSITNAQPLIKSQIFVSKDSIAHIQVTQSTDKYFSLAYTLMHYYKNDMLNWLHATQWIYTKNNTREFNIHLAAAPILDTTFNSNSENLAYKYYAAGINYYSKKYKLNLSPITEINVLKAFMLINYYQNIAASLFYIETFKNIPLNNEYNFFIIQDSITLSACKSNYLKPIVIHTYSLRNEKNTIGLYKPFQINPYTSQIINQNVINTANCSTTEKKKLAYYTASKKRKTKKYFTCNGLIAIKWNKQQFNFSQFAKTDFKPNYKEVFIPNNKLSKVILSVNDKTSIFSLHPIDYLANKAYLILID